VDGEKCFFTDIYCKKLRFSKKHTTMYVGVIMAVMTTATMATTAAAIPTVAKAMAVATKKTMVAAVTMTMVAAVTATAMGTDNNQL
jgi:hypothetical protein